MGPILFNLYTSPLGDIMRHRGVSFHFYADDTLIDYTFKCSIGGDMDSCKRRVEASIRDIDSWMLCNNLRLNNDKTEFLLLNAQHRPSLPLDSILAVSKLIQASDHARNFGVVFDRIVSLDNIMITSGFIVSRGLFKV